MCFDAYCSALFVNYAALIIAYNDHSASFLKKQSNLKATHGNSNKFYKRSEFKLFLEELLQARVFSAIYFLLLRLLHMFSQVVISYLLYTPIYLMDQFNIFYYIIYYRIFHLFEPENGLTINPVEGTQLIEERVVTDDDPDELLSLLAPTLELLTTVFSSEVTTYANNVIRSVALKLLCIALN